MDSTDVRGGAGHVHTVSRSRLLRQAALGASGMVLSSSLPALFSPGAAHAAISFTKSSLSVSYWANVTPKQAFMSVLNGFAKQYGLAVTFNPEPPDYAAFVQKFTTYLSSGYSGLDAMWIDDFSVASWGTGATRAPDPP